MAAWHTGPSSRLGAIKGTWGTSCVFLCCWAYYDACPVWDFSVGRSWACSGVSCGRVGVVLVSRGYSLSFVTSVVTPNGVSCSFTVLLYCTGAALATYDCPVQLGLAPSTDPRASMSDAPSYPLETQSLTLERVSWSCFYCYTVLLVNEDLISSIYSCKNRSNLCLLLLLTIISWNMSWIR